MQLEELPCIHTKSINRFRAEQLQQSALKNSNGTGREINKRTSGSLILTTCVLFFKQ
jgi:hypothetical protein